jgi:VanZ family protein
MIMSQNTRLFVHYWLPLLIWMQIIFLFSSQAHSGAITACYFGSWNVPVRKFGHLSEYFILAILGYRAFAYAGGVFSKKKWISAFMLCALYAFSDEWHQSFVPGRSAGLSDALLDIFGSSLALCFKFWRAKITCQRM